MEEEEALATLFPAPERVVIQTVPFEGQEYKVFTILEKEKPRGWGIVVDESGKVHPITFLVGIDAGGTVLGLRILEYRDIFGSEIKRRSFLRQFERKTLRDPLVVGRDIDAVTSATISSKAAAEAVKKALHITEELREKSALP